MAHVNAPRARDVCSAPDTQDQSHGWQALAAFAETELPARPKEAQKAAVSAIELNGLGRNGIPTPAGAGGWVIIFVVGAREGAPASTTLKPRYACEPKAAAACITPKLFVV
jgi:hypothetical protein